MCRPVNSSVRFLLNAVAQRIESGILNLNEPADALNAHAARMVRAPRADLELMLRQEESPGGAGCVE